ncbi:MAG: hypothetical protein MR782_04830 [Campylobacter sp.]|nr:hypothetical protein [Campylobacter sp.]
MALCEVPLATLYMFAFTFCIWLSSFLYYLKSKIISFFVFNTGYFIKVSLRS